jgi:DNA invertase Pin-like site-specific DNA recombinase
MAKIGYQRVSTEGQNLDRQQDAFAALSVEKVFTDKASGKSTADRPGLKEMLGYVRQGDVLHIESISRLGRNVRDLLDIVATLETKGVQLVSAKEQLDTSTPMGRCLIQIMAAMAEMERASLLERQREGIRAAKKRGKHLGRPKVKVPADWDKVVAQWQEGKITATAAVKALGISRTSFYKLIKAKAA